MAGGGDLIGGQTGNLYTISWDLSELEIGESFNINVSFGFNHSYSEFVLTQTAIPEPATYALGLAAVGLTLVAFIRRKRCS